MISQPKPQISIRSHPHATAIMLEPRKSLTFLRVSPGGCSGVEKLVVGILFFSRRHIHIHNSNDYTQDDIYLWNHLRVIMVKSAHRVSYKHIQCTQTLANTHRDPQSKITYRWCFKHKSLDLQKMARLLFSGYSLASITQLL